MAAVVMTVGAVERDVERLRVHQRARGVVEEMSPVTGARVLFRMISTVTFLFLAERRGEVDR
jgi:hypothetical protein